MSELQEWELFMPVTVGAHIQASTVISHQCYPGEGRATVAFEGTNSAIVTLFLPRAEVARLRDALTAVIAELDTELDAEVDAERAALDESGVTDSAA